MAAIQDLNWQALGYRMRKPAWVFDARSITDPFKIKRLASPWRVGDGRVDGKLLSVAEGQGSLVHSFIRL